MTPQARRPARRAVDTVSPAGRRAGQAAVPSPRTPASARRARRPSPWRELVQYPLFAVLGLVAAFNSLAGQVMVVVFGLYVLLRKRDPRLSFGLALFLLLAIPLFQVLGRTGIAENIAIYVYELLVIGTISAVIQLRKTGGLPE